MSTPHGVMAQAITAQFSASLPRACRKKAERLDGA
jgi:hypothetical protein